MFRNPRSPVTPVFHQHRQRPALCSVSDRRFQASCAHPAAAMEVRRMSRSKQSDRLVMARDDDGAARLRLRHSR